MKIIIRQAELEELYKNIDDSGRFAIDLEFIPERSFQPILCLVQINVGQQTFIVDPLKVQDLNGLWERIANSEIQKVLHAGVQDLHLIFQLSSRVPSNIFDTQIAAGFAGFGFPTGYGKLLQQLLGITITKSESFTDWLERPLSPSQIEYAREDVCHLLPMADKLVEILERQGRLNWALEECKLYCETQEYIPAKTQDFARVKGASGLNRRALAVLQRLYEFRDAEAKRIDRPPRSVLSDTTLVELSRKLPSSITDIQRMRGIRPDQVRAFGKRLIEHIEAGLAIPAEECPKWPTTRRTPKREALIGDMLYSILKVVAYQADIATELLATRDDVQKLVRLIKEGDSDKSDFALLKGWRFEMAGKFLCDLVRRDKLRLHFNLDSDPPVRLETEERVV